MFKFTLGNSKKYVNAKLEDCECEGDILKSIASYEAAGDPLSGCCAEGVNHRQANAYQLIIYGKCCSECYLVQSSHSWKHPVKVY